MMEAPRITEYGVPLDADAIVNPSDPEMLELEAGHPGIGDAAYIRRRQDLFALCRRHRLENLGPPIIQYSPDETDVWRDVSANLDGLHRQHACSMYNEAK